MVNSWRRSLASEDSLLKDNLAQCVLLMMNREKIVQVDDCSYPFLMQLGNNRTQDPGEDSGSQGEAK